MNNIPDREDLAEEPLGQYFARLLESDREALRSLSVLHWFDRPLYEFWAENTNLQLEFERAIKLGVIRPLNRTRQHDRFIVLSSFREQLIAGLRRERNDQYVALHRLAAKYFHHPLTDVDSTTVGDVIEELSYLTVADPDSAVSGFSKFAYAALLAGWTEAASRAAQVMNTAETKESGDASLFPVARLVIALAAVLAEAVNGQPSTAELVEIVTNIKEPRNADERALIALARQALDRFSPGDPVIHILWMNGGLSCDGDSVALTAATQPSIEEILLGALPGLPKIAMHWPLIDFECGPEQGADTFIEWWHKADRGELDPFILVVEGSIPNEAIKQEGYWCGFGNNPVSGQPITTSEWLDRLAPKATAILAVGTCATYGGIHAMAGNPTGAMGVPDYLGWEWKSKAGLPIVCVPGCPIHPDNLSETILYLLYQVAGQAPMIPLDEALRPRWLFEATVHEGCDRAGYYEQGQFATEYGSPSCLVKLGCWGPVVKCNVPKRGWINGVGGCPNVGGICIACTMPGFPDKFMPFMDEPPGARVSTTASGMYGTVIRTLRGFTARTADKEPKWRAKGSELLTGYQKTW